MDWFHSIVAFLVAHRELLAVLIGMLVGVATSFLLEVYYFPDSWSPRKCGAWATIASLIAGAGYTYGLWRAWVPDDGKGYVFLVSSACAISQPFLYYVLSKFVLWKFTKVDITFGPKRKDPPKDEHENGGP